MAKQTYVKRILALVVFGSLAFATWPATLAWWLPDSYIGEWEERRYYATLSVVALASAIASLAIGIRRLAQPLSVVLYVVGVALVTELASAFVVLKVTRESHLPRRESAFIFHPALVGVPAPGYFKSGRDGIVIRHNRDGWRGEEIRPKERGRIRIIAIGGSTTYGTMLSNDDVWPHRLAQLLGDRYEVLNLGVPGHSSAEHVILTALKVSDFAADYIVYYLGWNDLRNAHLVNLRSDYSDFHLLEQFSTLGVEMRYRAHSATLFVLKWMLVQAGELDAPKERLKDGRGRESSEFDERLAPIFERNIAVLTAASRAIGAEPIFVPQVLNEHFATRDHVTWWVPLVPVTSIYGLNSRMNEILRVRVRAVGAALIDAPALASWEPTDFQDHGHFSPQGSEKFARVVHDQLVPIIAAYKR